MIVKSFTIIQRAVQNQNSMDKTVVVIIIFITLTLTDPGVDSVQYTTLWVFKPGSSIIMILDALILYTFI